MNPWHSAVSPGPKQGLALPKTPGTYLPESLPTSKTLSPPGQVPFLAYYILPYTFSVFSPLSVESCADLQPPNHQLKNEVEWTWRMRWGWRWSSGFLQSSGHWKCLLYAQGKKALRRASVSYWWLTSPCTLPAVSWTGGGGAADLPPAHPSSHCKADQRPRANSWVIWATGPF